MVHLQRDKKGGGVGTELREGGGGEEVAGKVRAPIHQVTKQTVNGWMGPAHRQILYSAETIRGRRGCRERPVCIWTSPSGLLAQQHGPPPATPHSFSESPACGNLPGGKQGWGWDAQVKPRYFLITLAEVEGEGFHLGAGWMSL